MSDDTTTEEQKQVKKFFERWSSFRGRTETPYILVLIASLFLFFVMTKKIDENYLGTYVAVLAIFLAAYSAFAFSLWKHHSKQFIHNLTPSEYEMLTNIDLKSLRDDESLEIGRLLRLYQKVNPQKELLRASAEAQEDTLLRAAAYTETTPQDQLLRPADDDKPHPSNGNSH